MVSMCPSQVHPRHVACPTRRWCSAVALPALDRCLRHMVSPYSRCPAEAAMCKCRACRWVGYLSYLFFGVYVEFVSDCPGFRAIRQDNLLKLPTESFLILLEYRTDRAAESSPDSSIALCLANNNSHHRDALGPTADPWTTMGKLFCLCACYILCLSLMFHTSLGRVLTERMSPFLLRFESLNCFYFFDFSLQVWERGSPVVRLKIRLHVIITLSLHTSHYFCLCLQFL